MTIYESKVWKIQITLYEGTPKNITLFSLHYTLRSESRCALRLRYADLVVSIEAAVEVCLMSWNCNNRFHKEHLRSRSAETSCEYI
jgi:hypothetical protein